MQPIHHRPAARKTAVDRVRAEVAAAGGQVLFLDGGDVNTGVPESDLQDAAPGFLGVNRLGMNRLGVDAMAVGNHGFDKPPAVLAKQRQWARCPMLSANIWRQTPQGVQRMFQPYTVFERGGWCIGVMGLTTDDTAKRVLPSNVSGIEFRKPAEEAAKLLPGLRAKSDMVIAVTPMGAELLQFLQAAARMTPGAGGYPQTAGLRMQINGGQVGAVFIGGAPLVLQRSELLAINNFTATATASDADPPLDQHPGYVNTGLVDVDVEVTREYVARLSPLKVADFGPGEDIQRR